MTDVIYDEVNGRADVIVSGEWLLPEHVGVESDNPGIYTVGYAATLFRDGWWSGGCNPIMTREVVERLMEQQNAYVEANGFDGRLSWDGDVLVLTTSEDEDEIRSEPTPEGYDVGFGWTWAPVDYAECAEVVGDAPRIVQVRFVYPQSLLDKYGEDDLIASVQARLDEFYPGDGDCYVTPHVEVAVVQ